MGGHEVDRYDDQQVHQRADAADSLDERVVLGAERHRTVPGGREIAPGEIATPLSGAALSQCEEAAKTRVGGLAGWIDENRGTIGQVEAGADDAADIRFFAALMGANGARQGASVGDAEGGDAEDGGACEQLLDVGGAADE